MMDLCHGLNNEVPIPDDNDFSFYLVPFMLHGPSAYSYVELKMDILYGMHGDRGISSIRRKWIADKRFYEYSAIVCVKDENELIFRLKYENARLLYVIPRGLTYDIYMESIPKELDTVGNICL